MPTSLKGKRILITGACGTIGRELVRQLLEDYKTEEVVGIDNNESELFFLEQQFADYPKVEFKLADVRDAEKIYRILEGIHVVFHTAAYKHVLLCEKAPFEAVQTNIIGVNNIINAALKHTHVEKVILTSSDKAVNPTNVMGTSKLMDERLMTAANSNQKRGKTIFISTRFGNVLGSRGSVIPIFKEQIRRGGPVTLTDKGMTRFIMSIREAVRLVIDSENLACGGEVFVTKMPVIRIEDLAQVMIKELAPKFGYDHDDIDIKDIGTKPGEKMYEELLSLEETRRTYELERYFSVIPAFRNVYKNITYEYQNMVSDKVFKPYNSANEEPLSQGELLSFLRRNNLLFEAGE